MDSVQNEERKHLVTPGNWRAYSDHLHAKIMDQMEIERGTLTELVFVALEMGGEKEGVLNEVKKIWRDGNSEEAYRRLYGEVADLLIMLDHLIKIMDKSAMELCVVKIQELTERWPHYFEDFAPQQAN